MSDAGLLEAALHTEHSGRRVRWFAQWILNHSDVEEFAEVAKRMPTRYLRRAGRFLSLSLEARLWPFDSEPRAVELLAELADLDSQSRDNPFPPDADFQIGSRQIFLAVETAMESGIAPCQPLSLAFTTMNEAVMEKTFARWIALKPDIEEYLVCAKSQPGGQRRQIGQLLHFSLTMRLWPTAQEELATEAIKTMAKDTGVELGRKGAIESWASAVVLRPSMFMDYLSERFNLLAGRARGW